MTAETTGQVDLTGKVSMVTGAAGGMGRVIATELSRLGSTVVIVTRSDTGGEQVRRQIVAEVGADRVEVLAGDLAVRGDLRRVAEEFAARHQSLHVLVNNAGAHYRQRLVNADGIEMHVAVNHLAGFGLGWSTSSRTPWPTPAPARSAAVPDRSPWRPTNSTTCAR
jgi:NAD(P)-dependent dehydrogenase (short-subunit alcohol dehydrogenase family)